MIPKPERVVGIFLLANATAGMLPSSPPAAFQFITTDETPLPGDMWPTRVADMPTGQDLIGPVEDLILTAAAVQRSLAVLPIDPVQERIVEQYIREHTAERAGRRITKRGGRTAS